MRLRARGQSVLPLMLLISTLASLNGPASPHSPGSAGGSPAPVSPSTGSAGGSPAPVVSPGSARAYVNPPTSWDPTLHRPAPIALPHTGSAGGSPAPVALRRTGTAGFQPASAAPPHTGTAGILPAPVALRPSHYPAAPPAASPKPVRRHTAPRLTLTLASFPAHPVALQTGQVVAALSRPVGDGTVTFTMRHPTVGAVYTCTPVHGRCAMAWSARAAGSVTLAAHWSGDKHYAPADATLTVGVARAAHTYSGTW